MQLAEISAGKRLVAGFESAVEMDQSVLIRTSWRSGATLELAQSVAQGLARRPRRLEYRFLYDARGSALFEQITEQPEYYPTRTEASILRRFSHEIRSETGPVTLLELGSGSSDKTHHLIEAYLARDEEQCYVPVDVSEAALRQAAAEVGRRHTGVQVVSVHGTYEMAMRLLGRAAPALVVFLGSSIGNFSNAEERRFWNAVAREMPEGSFFLLGVDLVKDPELLNAAYNDAAGITAAFTRNLFVRMNRELGSGLDTRAIRHQARYVPERQRVEIHARFERAQTLSVLPLRRRFRIAAGEPVLLEISRKYQLPALTDRLAGHGFAVRRVFTDERDWFALLLLQRSGPAGRHGR